MRGKWRPRGGLEARSSHPCLLRGLLPLALAVLLSACALRPTPHLPPAAAPLPTAPEGPPAAVMAYLAEQRAIAAAAATEGRWVDAAWAWDIVLALSPQDETAQKGRAAALGHVQAQVTERLPLARTARARGQIDLASRLFLEILALAPGHLEAANALRTIERDRARRQAVGSFARALAPPDPTRSDAQARTSARRLDLEHASLLAGQGDIDAAIALLLPTPTSRPGDAASRKLLADLYLKRADKLAASDRPAAIEAVRQSLRWQPANAQARVRLNQWLGETPAATPASTAPAARQRALNRPSSAPSSGR